MKNIFVILIAAITFPLFGSPETTGPMSQHATEEASLSDSNEESPFLIERQDAKEALARAAKNNTSVATLFPPRHSISRQVSQFFKNLVGTTKSAASKTPVIELGVEPAPFSITEDPELTVSLKITNVKKEMVMFSFPTNQRLEIIIKDASDTIVTRWSEDRLFESSSDIVVINPGESIRYSEKIATSMMKEGVTYTLTVSLVDQPGYTASQKITPQKNNTDHSFLKESEETTPLKTSSSPFKI